MLCLKTACSLIDQCIYLYITLYVFIFPICLC